MGQTGSKGVTISTAMDTFQMVKTERILARSPTVPNAKFEGAPSGLAVERVKVLGYAAIGGSMRTCEC